MIERITDVQLRAVNEIYDKYTNNIHDVCLKAPTGSGKTFIIANLISKILENRGNTKVLFVFATLSSAELPSQLENKLIEYQKYCNCKFDVKYVRAPSNNKNIKDERDISRLLTDEIADKKVIILGKQAFGKKSGDSNKGLQIALAPFMSQVLDVQKYDLIYIRDEAHNGAEKKTEIEDNFETQLQTKSKFVVKMTATPKTNENLVLITEDEINNPMNGQYLLKSTPQFNLGISEIQQDTLDNKDFLNVAIKKFKEVKKLYKSDDEIKVISPAMLIQLDDKTKENSRKWDETFSMVIDELNKSGLSYAIYFSDIKKGSLKEEVSLASISDNQSGYDVILFKVGPSTGWDIPRACMLVQLRNISSSTLNTQTLGRIKRNPTPFLNKNIIADKYYVYSNYQESTRRLYQYNLKPKYINEKFPSIRIECDEQQKTINNKKYKKEINALLNSCTLEFKEKLDQIFTDKCKFVDISTEKLFSSNSNRKTLVSNRVHNVIELEIEIKRLLSENGKYFESIEKDIEKFYNTKIKTFTLIHFYYVIFQNCLNKIRNLYHESFYGTKSGLKYKKQNVLLQKNYSIWCKKDSDGIDQFVPLNNIDKEYMYECIGKQKVQALDSNPEIQFMNTVIRGINSWAENEIENKISCWAKNQTLGTDLYIEYLLENNLKEICKAYIDFVFKIKDKYLFVEVKSVNDYDETKTKSIVKSFQKISDQSWSKNLFFCIVKVDLSEREPRVFSEKVYTSNKKFNGATSEFNSLTIIKILNEIYKLK